jgi:hypothetical protein
MNAGPGLSAKHLNPGGKQSKDLAECFYRYRRENTNRQAPGRDDLKPCNVFSGQKRVSGQHSWRGQRLLVYYPARIK